LEARLALNPYTVNGEALVLEPPHMQSSLVFLPAKEQPPPATRSPSSSG
jgi:hypothetical protein